MATAETRFDIGDTAYMLRRDQKAYNVTCSLCMGHGKVALLVDATKSVTCPDCRGEGKIFKETVVTHEIETFEINSLEIRVHQDGTEQVRYFTGQHCAGGVGREMVSYRDNFGSLLYGSIPEAKGAMEDNGWFSMKELLGIRAALEGLIKEDDGNNSM